MGLGGCGHCGVTAVTRSKEVSTAQASVELYSSTYFVHLCYQHFSQGPSNRFHISWDRIRSTVEPIWVIEIGHG